MPAPNTVFCNNVTSKQTVLVRKWHVAKKKKHLQNFLPEKVFDRGYTPLRVPSNFLWKALPSTMKIFLLQNLKKRQNGCSAEGILMYKPQGTIKMQSLHKQLMQTHTTLHIKVCNMGIHCTGLQCSHYDWRPFPLQQLWQQCCQSVDYRWNKT